jgi:glutaredoxin
MATLEMLTREGCGLCDEMHEALEALRPDLALPPLAIVDVDSDPQLKRRFGLKVPVLRLDGVVVCFGRLDVQELKRLLGRPAAVAG